MRADALRQQADELSVLADELEVSNDRVDDQWLSLKDIQKRYGKGRGAVLAAEKRGELELGRSGGRGEVRIRLSEMERWLAVKKPQEPSDPEAEDADGDEWLRRQLEQLERHPDVMRAKK